MADTPARKGSYTETFTGKQFWVLDPRAEEVDIRDIAHSHSQLCRFNGHTREFFSVAQHCLNVAADLEAQGASTRTVLFGLIHDASEAYFCDLPRPVKNCFPEYRAIEENLEHAIFDALAGGPPTSEEWTAVMASDTELLQYEGSLLMPNSPVSAGQAGWARPTRPYPTLDLSPKDMKVVENQFIHRYHALVKQLQVENRSVAEAAVSWL